MTFSEDARKNRLREILEARNGIPMLATVAVRIAGYKSNPDAVLAHVDWPDLVEYNNLIYLDKSLPFEWSLDLGDTKRYSLKYFN